jgi:hypothetical protein
MYGLTRGTITLVWLATQIDNASNGGYWAIYGLIAAAGLVMAFSQILGGWTKWGWPRLSLNVFLIAFLPVLVAAGWVVVAHQPDPNWFRTHVLNWSDNVGILGLVRDLTEYVAVLARSAVAGVQLRFPPAARLRRPRRTTGRPRARSARPRPIARTRSRASARPPAPSNASQPVSSVPPGRDAAGWTGADTREA